MSLRKIAFFSFLLITSSCDYSCPPASNDYTTVMEEYTEWENQNVLCPACGGSGVFTYYYSEICARYSEIIQYKLLGFNGTSVTIGLLHIRVEIFRHIFLKLVFFRTVIYSMT